MPRETNLSMQKIDWDDAFDNMGHVEGSGSLPAFWLERAAAYRDALPPGQLDCDIAYGDGARQKLDIVWPDGPVRGLAVFVHGGFWMRLDKSYWTDLAEGARTNGWAVCIPSYTLVPAARISAITAEIGQAITMAASRVEGQIVLAGHSAGGHLVTRMLCDDSPLSQAVKGRIAGCLSISGLHDLRPLQKTSMCAALQLDGPDAAAESPALLLPKPGARLHLAVGADERPEFLRQSALLANIWYGLGAETALQTIEGRHHYDICDGLTDPDSLLTDLFVGGNSAEDEQKAP